jgi:hypothetical protein
MGNILNFVFAEKNRSKILRERYINGHESEKFHASALFNWIQHRLGSISITTDYQIKKDSTNIFLIETRETLRNFFDFDLNDKLKNLIRTGQLKVLVGMVSEGTPNLDKFEDEIHFFGQLNSISLDSFIFIDSNKQIEKCKKINWYYVPHCVYVCGISMKEMTGGHGEKNDLNYVPTVLTDTEAKNNLDRKYYFISLNRSNWRKHRVLLGCYFIEKNDDRILWSYLSEPTHLAWFDELGENHKKLYSNNIENLKKVVPKMVLLPEIKQLDTYSKELVGSFATDDTHDKDTALNYYFDIVTECMFGDSTTDPGENITITEKIMKPIINLHPFIVITTGGFLKELKSLGFKTYDGLFDESYDDIVDKWERFDFITNEIDRILSKSREEIRDLYEKYLDVCIYNRNHLLKNYALGDEKQWDNIFKDIANG